MDTGKYIELKKRVVDRALDQYMPSAKTRPQLLHRAMRYAVFSGGKRLRPILTVASFEACGGKGNSVMPVACAIELIHTYTLIHDDMPCIDDDDFRRGKFSCHKKYNEAIALLAGDALLTLGFELLSYAGDIDIIKEISIAVGSQGTIGGQVVDINLHSAERTPHRKGAGQVAHSAELDYIAKNKTGALFEAACQAGAILSGAGKKKITALRDFGRYLGIAFQLVDDLIDKDGYVRAYGLVRTEKMARALTKKAKDSLKILGGDGKILGEISELSLRRKS